MAPALLRGSCAALLTVSVAGVHRGGGAARLDVDTLDGKTDAVPKLFASSDMTICGGKDIWQFLAAPKTADEIRNIPWSQVDAVAAEFIRSQDAEVKTLTTELEGLRARIAEREKAEAPKPIGQDQIVSSITRAVASTLAYGSLDVAKTSKCGAVLVRPRLSRTAYQASVSAFNTTIWGVLSGGRISVQSQIFTNTCNSLLSATAGDLGSFCDELCLDLADAAKKASDSFAGALAVNGESADSLRRKAEETAANIRAAQSKLEGCQQTKTDLAVFKSQLLGITGEVKDKHGKLMDARDALLDAQYELMDAADSLAAQQAETKRAADILAAAGEVAKAALAKMQEAGRQAVNSRTALNGTQQELASVQQRLKSAQDTSDVVAQLKASVADSMMMMTLYFDEAVRKPLRLLGFGSCAANYFPTSPTTLDSAKATRASMEALNSFCTRAQTRAALSAGATAGVNPQELCSIGELPAIQKDVDDAVAQALTTLREHLAQVHSWLDPYRGQSATEREAIKTAVEQGELVGLREVMSAFGSTSYYRQYLSNWQVKGKFLDILRALATAIKDAQEAQTQATARLEAAKVQLAASQQALVQATQELEKALANKAFSEGQHKEAQRILQTLNARVESIRKDISALEAACAEAERRYQEAKASLEDTHREGVSLVELLHQLEALESA